MTTPVSIRQGGIFLGSKGGNGHNAAREALLKQFLKEKGIEYAQFQQNPRQYSVQVLDMMSDILDKYNLPVVGRLGEFCKNKWDNAQKAGDLETQEAIVGKQWMAESIFSHIVYDEIKTHLLSLEHEPEVFWSTQALCTSDIARAIDEVNRIRGWNLKLDLWMTDLPTKKAGHFFRSLKKCQNYAHVIRLHAPKPMKQRNDSCDEDFWKRHIGSNIEVITEETFPIRKRFLDQEPIYGKEVDLKIKINQPGQDGLIDDLDVIRLGITDEMGPFVSDSHLELHIKGTDQVGTLMLGSKPSRPGVLAYIREMIACAAEQEEAYLQAYRQYERELELYNIIMEGPIPMPPPKYHFFIFTGEGESSNSANALLRDIKELLANTQMPKNFNIIPFTFQSDDCLAPLLSRSIPLIRSGGLSCMEVLHQNRAQRRPVFIHAEDMFMSKMIDTQSITYRLDGLFVFCSYIFLWLLYRVGLVSDAPLIINEEFKQGLAEKIHAEYPDYSIEELLEIINNPFGQQVVSPLRVSQLINRINEDPVTQQDEILSEILKLLSDRALYEDPDHLSSRKIKALQKLYLKTGIPLWEGGNAKYLIKELEAQIITPFLAKKLLKKHFFNLYT